MNVPPEISLMAMEIRPKKEYNSEGEEAVGDFSDGFCAQMAVPVGFCSTWTEINNLCNQQLIHRETLFIFIFIPFAKIVMDLSENVPLLTNMNYVKMLKSVP